MNKDAILTILNKCKIFLLLFICSIVAFVWFLGFSKEPEFLKAPIPSAYHNISSVRTLKKDLIEKQKDLERILEDKKLKNEAAKNATVKEFYKTTAGTGDVVSDLSPMFDNIITMIKQNGIRMKSIKNTPSPGEDSLIKAGNGAYSGCKVDFELVGYYTQFTAFLNDLSNYPYFINVAKFEITPYQYDKRILIANVSIVFYSKK